MNGARILGIKLLETAGIKSGMSVEATPEGLYCCVTDLKLDKEDKRFPVSSCRTIPWATVKKAFKEITDDTKTD